MPGAVISSTRLALVSGARQTRDVDEQEVRKVEQRVLRSSLDWFAENRADITFLAAHHSGVAEFFQAALERVRRLAPFFGVRADPSAGPRPVE